jgi:hypothetical protein
MSQEDIWNKIKKMSLGYRKQLAYEMILKGFDIGYIHPHYYFDAKAVHDILFYPSNSQHEIEDKEGAYYNALKRIIENDEEIHVRVKRFAWLPRFINDWREGKIVKDYICSRINEEYVNAWYKILPGKSLAGERSHTLYFCLNDEKEILYKMKECSFKDGYEQVTCERM